MTRSLRAEAHKCNNKSKLMSNIAEGTRHYCSPTLLPHLLRPHPSELPRAISFSCEVHTVNYVSENTSAHNAHQKPTDNTRTDADLLRETKNCREWAGKTKPHERSTLRRHLSNNESQRQTTTALDNSPPRSGIKEKSRQAPNRRGPRLRVRTGRRRGRRARRQRAIAKRPTRIGTPCVVTLRLARFAGA
jgi:hypothetical protein